MYLKALRSTLTRIKKKCVEILCCCLQYNTFDNQNKHMVFVPAPHNSKWSQHSFYHSRSRRLLASFLALGNLAQPFTSFILGFLFFFSLESDLQSATAHTKSVMLPGFWRLSRVFVYGPRVISVDHDSDINICFSVLLHKLFLSKVNEI